MRISVVWLCCLLSVLAARADDPAVQVSRGRRFTQVAGAQPAPRADASAYYFRAAAVGLEALEPVTGAQLTLPNGTTKALPKIQPGLYVFEADSPSGVASGADFPAGKYLFSATVNFLGATKAHADLAAATFPEAPVVDNLAEAQTVDASADFTLRWQPFAGAQSNAKIALQIKDSTGSSIVDERMSATDTEWFLSSGTFQPGATYQAVLTFSKFTSQSDPDAGELLTGQSSWNSETAFSLTARTGGAVEDHTPPALSQVSPENGTVMTSQLGPVVFQFSEPMDPTKSSVTWQATLNGAPQALNTAGFSPLWTDDGRSLVFTYGLTTGGWPSGWVVTWTLNPQPGMAGNFRDLAGNELPSATGTFLTAGGVDPCSSQSPGAVPGSVFGFFKQVNYRQSTADQPDPDADLGAQAFAFLQLPASAPVQTVVTLKVPTDNPFAFKLKALSVPGGATGLRLRLLQEQFPARSDLDAAYPAGTYAMELRTAASQVTNSASLTVLATGYPPIPHAANFTACQAIEAETDFNVQWDPFTTAVAGQDYTSFNLYDASGALVLQAPDPCHNVKLDPVASGFVIPKGMLSKNSAYTVELTFSRMSDSGKTLDGVAGTGFASLTRITRWPLHTSGGTVVLTPPRFESYALSPDGRLDITLSCLAGRPLLLESAVSVGSAFSSLLTTNPPSNRLSISFPISGAIGLIRAQQQ